QDVVQELVVDDVGDEVARHPFGVEAGMDPDQPLDRAVAAKLDGRALLAARLRAASPGDEDLAEAPGEVTLVQVLEDRPKIVHLPLGPERPRSSAPGAD